MKSQIYAPYRAVGFISNHVPFDLSVKGSEHFVTTVIGTAFHEYSCSRLNLVFAGQPMKNNISYLVTTKHFTLVASENAINLYQRGKKVTVYTEHDHEVIFMIAIGNIIVSCDDSNQLNVWSDDTLETHTTIQPNPNTFQVTAIIHPSTYLNKILIGSKQGKLQIWNIRTNKMIYEIKGWSSEVTVLKQAPAVDVIAVGLQDGNIYIHNIKVDKTLMSFLQESGPIITISFRTDGTPIMAAGGSDGTITFWDLEKRRIASSQTRAHNGSVTSMEFFQKQPLLLTAGPDNSLKVWIFDYPDGSCRLLKSRCGHSAPPTRSLFFGSYGNVILTSGMDNALRYTSIMRGVQCHEFSQGSVISKANRKGVNVDVLKLPPITCIAGETSRQHDWDDIVTCHLGMTGACTWSSDKRAKGKHKLKKDKHNAALVADISSCGNFCIVGCKNGSIEKYNMQSGIHRGTFGQKKKCKTHTKAVRGVSIDLANYMLVSTSADKTIKFWNFKDGYLLHTVECHCPVKQSKLHRDSSLLAVSFDDFSLQIYDIDTKRMVRQFAGHSNTITDISWSVDGRWLVSCSMDGTIRTWDIPSSRLVDCFLVDQPATSVALSPTSEFLATTHQDNLGIYLWSNKVIYTGIHPTPLPNDYEPVAVELPTTQIEVEEQEEAVEENPDLITDIGESYQTPDQLGDLLVTLSLLPESRWKSLTCIDLIKERNKPKQPPKKPKAAPFFLPTIAGIETKFDNSKKDDEVQQVSEKDRFLKRRAFDATSEFQQLLQDGAFSEEKVELLSDRLKKFSPSEADIELRTLSPEAGGTDMLMLNFMKMLTTILKTGRNYELIHAYMSLFLKLVHFHLAGNFKDNSESAVLHGDYIRQSELLRTEAQLLLELCQGSWLHIDELINQSLCLIRYFKSATI